ncbi:unnamed protein product [Rangifer tarandus platyrhynchus]|uniref:Uncharacterized protein n=2 Tax=Rangifer tarandus platyrhynchus TaxID=3082113 RepID=A0ABN8YWA9_RANTA|nr:unnamed protein product [Rangifer tarandus platyrhynchus]CAI9693677.1 unnamed protein product [Rangifer tarandus platyrhynchus]
MRSEPGPGGGPAETRQILSTLSVGVLVHPYKRPPSPLTPSRPPGEDTLLLSCHGCFPTKQNRSPIQRKAQSHCGGFLRERREETFKVPTLYPPTSPRVLSVVSGECASSRLCPPVLSHSPLAFLRVEALTFRVLMHQQASICLPSSSIPSEAMEGLSAHLQKLSGRGVLSPGKPSALLLLRPGAVEGAVLAEGARGWAGGRGREGAVRACPRPPAPRRQRLPSLQPPGRAHAARTARHPSRLTPFLPGLPSLSP